MNLIFDSIIMVLLVITIGYCFKLNSRLKVITGKKSELTASIAYFQASIERAIRAIEVLRTVGDDVNSKLDKKTFESRKIADDMAFLVEKGGKLLDALDIKAKACKEMENGLSLKISARGEEERKTLKKLSQSEEILEDALKSFKAKIPA